MLPPFPGGPVLDQGFRRCWPVAHDLGHTTAAHAKRAWPFRKQCRICLRCANPQQAAAVLKHHDWPLIHGILPAGIVHFYNRKVRARPPHSL